MRILLIALAALPAAAGPQDPPEPDQPGRMRIVVTGCVKGSTLTESNLRMPGDPGGLPPRRWRLRGPKDLMKQIKDRRGRELEIAGSTKDADADTVGRVRVGRSNVFIGGGPMGAARDPVPEPPTIDVESFEPTGEACR